MMQSRSTSQMNLLRIQMNPKILNYCQSCLNCYHRLIRSMNSLIRQKKMNSSRSFTT